eukprot:gnl/TRDRNA2_/TRDRNA2_32075_c0_seq1.p1 gnl/TRDRNA2_/TRDRNA2_32075_c0~~gnl/TRDRNA2_/TRDRNA2_32075_c0_seq1.p1  ORF type:complete len:413 (+),score=63.48 gnl/TRDRNA2_/TRDRNA2_32075_c0_seq1:62-1300(+)
MAFAHGRLVTAMPGPTVVPEKVLNAMHRASPNIYEGEIPELSKKVARDLCKVARTQHHVAMHVGNGHAAWEASLANVLDVGDVALVLDSGIFANGWGKVASANGIETDTIKADWHRAIDPSALEQRLRADTAHRIKAVLAVHTDSSSSSHNNIPALRAAVDAAGHPALFLVDCIATLACVEFEMDKWGVDVTVTASQKGLMIPPGLSFTFFNDKAVEARRRKPFVPPYFDWLRRLEGGPAYLGWGGTPPTHQLSGLAVSLNMILEEVGLEKTWERHEIFAHAVWAAVEAWGRQGSMRFNVQNPAERSRVVTLVYMDGFDCRQLRQWCQEEANLVLGKPVGVREESSAFRIGHMGHMNPPMLLGVLGTLDCGLKALGIPHGSGALDAAANVLASRWTNSCASARRSLSAGARL